MDGTAKTIDQLPEKKELVAGDMFPIDDGAQTYCATWATILAAAGGIKEVETSTGKIKITLHDGTVLDITTSDPTKQPLLTWDNAPTSGSENPVTSDGIFQAVAATGDKIDQAGERIAANSAAIEEETKRAAAAEQENKAAIDKLNGDEEMEGSVAHTTAEAIAKLIAGAPESLDTLKEIAAWIEGHAGDAAAMNQGIKANAKAIEEEARRAKEAEKAADDRLSAFGLYIDDDGDICQK